MVWRAMGTVILRNSGDAWVTITSGLARGIDGVAHKAALQVMASALLYWGMDLIPFIPAAMPDWLPVCLNMAELSSRNFPSMFHPLLTISHEEIALSVV